MARKVTAYACQFGCKRNVLTSKKGMEEHEDKCFYNPSVKACISCEHFESYYDDNGMEGPDKHMWRQAICHKDLDIAEKLRSRCGLHAGSDEVLAECK